MNILRQFKWYFMVSMLMLACLIGLTVWIYIAADAPQEGPFEYQVF